MFLQYNKHKLMYLTADMSNPIETPTKENVVPINDGEYLIKCDHMKEEYEKLEKKYEKLKAVKDSPVSDEGVKMILWNARRTHKHIKKSIIQIDRILDRMDEVDAMLEDASDDYEQLEHLNAKSRLQLRDVSKELTPYYKYNLRGNKLCPPGRNKYAISKQKWKSWYRRYSSTKNGKEKFAETPDWNDGDSDNGDRDD